MKSVLCLLVVVLSCLISVTAMAEKNVNKEKQNTEKKQFNHQIKKIFNSGEYDLNRSKSIKELKNIDQFLTNKHLRTAFSLFFDSLTTRAGGDIDVVNFTPDMLLNEENKVKFETVFSYVNRNDLLDKLDLVNILIHSLKKVDDSSMFTKFVNQRYYITHNTDMAHHWLAYFLSKPEVNVNCYKKNSSTMEWIIYKNNYDAAKLLMEHGYKVTDFDFEVLREHIQVVSEDNEGAYDKDKALEALTKIEALLMDNINNKAPEPPPRRGFFD